MNKYDLEHKLQKGSILYLDNIPNYKITLGEMAELGFTGIQNTISLLCMDNRQAAAFFTAEAAQPSAYLFLVLSLLQEYRALADNQTPSRTLQKAPLGGKMGIYSGIKKNKLFIGDQKVKKAFL